MGVVRGGGWGWERWGGGGGGGGHLELFDLVEFFAAAEEARLQLLFLAHGWGEGQGGLVLLWLLRLPMTEEQGVFEEARRDAACCN